MRLRFYPSIRRNQSCVYFFYSFDTKYKDYPHSPTSMILYSFDLSFPFIILFRLNQWSDFRFQCKKINHLRLLLFSIREDESAFICIDLLPKTIFDLYRKRNDVRTRSMRALKSNSLINITIWQMTQ